jgi:hypothetical protein
MARRHPRSTPPAARPLERCAGWRGCEGWGWKAGLSTTNVKYSSAEGAMSHPLRSASEWGPKCPPARGCDATIPPGFTGWGPGPLHGGDIEDETTSNRAAPRRNDAQAGARIRPERG